MKKAVVSLVALSVVLLVAWMAISAFGGYRAQQGIETLIDQSPESTPLRFSDLKHEQGLLSSNGTVILHYLDPNADQQPRPDLFQMEIAYELDHRATFARMVSFDWTAALIGEGAQNMMRTFEDNPSLSGAGSLDWQGLAQSNYIIPALRAEQEDEVLDMSAITGNLKLQGKQFWFDLMMPSVEVTGEDGTYRLSNIALDLHANDRFTGQGRSEFSVQQFDFPEGQAKGFNVIGENVLADDRVGIAIKKSIDNLTVADTNVSDVALDLMLDGLYAPSVTSLSAVMNVAGNLDNLTLDQQKIVQGALRDLFINGFSVGITDLSAATNQGSVAGQAIATVKAAAAPSADFQFDARTQLEVIAGLDVTGQAVAPEVTALGMMFGVLVPNENGFKGSMSLSQGKLTINGTVVPFAEELAQINAMITEVLRGD